MPPTRPPTRSSTRSSTRTSRRSRPDAAPTLVLFVRHGETETTGKVLPGRARGLHLSDKGRAQAEAAAARIGALPKVAAVYTSPLERTRETAAPIARTVGVRARTTKGLVECDFGDWTGEALADLMKRPEWRTVQSAPSAFRFPGGESFAEMQTRIVTEVERLATSHRGEAIVCVSHADPIKAAVAHLAGTHLDLFQRIVISPCSITAVLVGEGSPVVLAVNSTGDDLTTLAPS